MNDIKDIFNAKAMESREHSGQSYDSVKITVKVKASDVRIADYIAKTIGTTRQEVLSIVIGEGLEDALQGVSVSYGMTSNEHWELLQSLIEGDDSPAQEKAS